jgi:hypothetical protein
MKKFLAVAVVTLLAGLAQPSGSLHASPAVSINAGTVKVTVSYAGKGKVDASHKIWVWLFDNPNIGAGSVPIDQMSLDKNDAEAVFEGVAPTQVYVAVAFDEQGVMTGDGPPPTGTPIGILGGQNGPPTGVTPGDKGAVKITFDDSFRMP